jgi:hypothetical protein
MKIKNSIIDISVLFGIMLILFYSSDPLIYPDSNRYLSGNLHDPPLYSSIISVMQLTFGTLNSVIVLQTLFIGFSIIYFVRTLTTQFNLDLATKTIISLFLFMPIIQFYRHLLTESFSYAFSLLFVSFIFKLIYDLNYKNLIWSTIFVIVLLLTRNQFLFLYPVILLLYSGILILHNSKKTLSWLIISFLSIVLIHNSVLNLNRYINQDSFKNQNSSDRSAFLFTFIDAIYISSSKDIKSFENQNIQKTLTKIFEEMDKQKALLKYYNGRGHFGLSLKDIRIYSNPLLKNLAIQEKTDVISLKKEISIKLITANFEKYIKHIFKKFYDSAWLFVFVPFFMLLASLINFIKHKSRFSLIVIFLSSFALANHSIVYLFGRVQPRYFIYTDFILLIFIFLTFSILLNKKYKKFI